jgi:hypothetical protein
MVLCRLRGLGLLLALAALAALLPQARPAIAAPPWQPPELLPCPDRPAEDELQQTWSACERFVWSCLAAGREANLFAKECAVPRTARNSELRNAQRFAPFVDIERYKGVNTLSSHFLHAVLSRKEYADRLTPAGVRIFGAVFEEPVNLENIAVDRNVVIDSSIFFSDLRMTNFRARYNVSFDGSNIMGRLLLLRARIDGSVFLQKGVYDHVDLRDARIGASIDAADSIFNGLFRLDRAHVEGKLEFERAKLTDWSAVDATIGGFARFFLADVRGRLDLTGARINGDLRMQKLRFGRWRGGPGVACDWNLDRDPKSFFSPLADDIASTPGLATKLVKSVVESRPSGSSLPDVSPAYVCARAIRPEMHEVLLREIKVGGTLCLIDATGEIETVPGESRPRPLGNAELPARPRVETISLDGSDTRATVIRWATSDSETLWRAVNYTTGYMLIDLEGQPTQHFIDNLEVRSIAFVSSKLNLAIAEGRAEDSDKTLCDITPDPKTAIRADSRLAHDRIISFFADDQRNRSRSAQPMGKIVERLQSSGAASTHLKMALSDYKFRRLCSTSEFFREWDKLGPVGALKVPFAAWRVSRGLLARPELTTFDQRLDEARRIGLDVACAAGIGSYKYAVSYGHEPHNIIYVIIMFVMLFWGLLALDDPSEDGLEGRPKRLGLLYSIDTFNPFPQIQLNRLHSQWRPNRPSLRIYLKFHRLIGFVLCIILAIGIYSAGR